MDPNNSAGQRGAIAALKRLAGRARVEEQCEFCAIPLESSHRHVLEVATRKLICSCDPCALRFENVVGRWKLIPRDARALPDFQITAAQWDNLALPINLAFLFYSTAAGKMLAMYPSPAGATESLLPLESWTELVRENPILERLEPDVEALLVNRVGDARQYFIAPIDRCYELVGLIRLHWRGLSGGEAVWGEIGRFFDRLNGGGEFEVRSPKFEVQSSKSEVRSPKSEVKSGGGELMGVGEEGEHAGA